MDKANEAYEERLEALREKRRSEEAAMRRDADRYRWLRGDGGESSSRWPRWLVEHWGSGWQPVSGSEMDAAIDEAIRRDRTPNNQGNRRA